jgi:hypothetical protein
MRIPLYVLALCGLLSACTSYDTRLVDRSTHYLGDSGRLVSLPAAPPVDNVSYWDGNGVSGSPHIVINLSHQRAYFYKDDQLVGVSQISTGREGYDTPAGCVM